MSLNIPYSQACDRNKDPILDTLSPYFGKLGSVLEIGSGTGQHAVYFAQHFPKLVWQTSDQAQYLDGVRAQLANNPLENLRDPLELDVSQSSWVNSGQSFDAIFTANSLHIMNWSQVESFFSGLATVSKLSSYLFVYGPFNYAGEFTSPSNAQFDEVLRSRGVGSAIRDFEAINQLAVDNGWVLLEDCVMPANNRCLIWKKA